MKIQVYTVAGRHHDLTVEPTDTILSLKDQIHLLEGISVEQLRLLFQGANLSNDSTFESLNIKDGDTIHMVIDIRG